MGTVIEFASLAELSAQHKRAGKAIISTNGAFDILHVGHVRALQSAKALKPNSILFVGVNSDASIRGYKSDKRPIIPEAQRAELLAALGCVDYVCIFNELGRYLRKDTRYQIQHPRNRRTATPTSAGSTPYSCMLRGDSPGPKSASFRVLSLPSTSGLALIISLT